MTLQCLHQEDIILQIRAQRDIYEKAGVLLRKTDWCSANGLRGVANKGTFSTGLDRKQGRVLPLPVELQEMLSPCASRLHLWSAKTNWTLKMKHLVPQCPSILVICCFCMLQIPSSGFPRPLADAPDGLDITQLEFILMHMSENNCPKIGKDNQDIYKRDPGTAAVDFTKKVWKPWGEPNSREKCLELGNLVAPLDHFWKELVPHQGMEETLKITPTRTVQGQRHCSCSPPNKCRCLRGSQRGGSSKGGGPRGTSEDPPPPPFPDFHATETPTAAWDMRWLSFGGVIASLLEPDPELLVAARAWAGQGA
ncbi:hypothetical protein PANDA_007845 [Ailuropoda melanoleuca]|uniref:Uncharacterized protein n=1 Tax=Ailuropoda melanoleuca TaxID=9646 RepID=D2HBE9_AILME|nr:hypothetical protein PANDA_007845 [Ailuropoda melanoleuca]